MRRLIAVLVPTIALFTLACGGDGPPTDPGPQLAVRGGQLTSIPPVTMPANVVQVDGQPHPYRLTPQTGSCEVAGSIPGTEEARTVTGNPGPRAGAHAFLDIIVEGHGDVGTVRCEWAGEPGPFKEITLNW